MFLFFGEPHGVFINCGDRKRGGAVRSLIWCRTVTLGRSCGGHWIFKADARRPQGDRRGALRRTCGQTDGKSGFFFLFLFTSSIVSACRIATASVEMKKVITPRYNSTAPLRPVKYSHKQGILIHKFSMTFLIYNVEKSTLVTTGK